MRSYFQCDKITRKVANQGQKQAPFPQAVGLTPAVNQPSISYCRAQTAKLNSTIR